MDAFTVDPAFDAGSVAAADWPLCHVRLHNDARFPWLILLPRRANLVELEDLTPAERVRLLEEVVRAGEAVRQLAALGDRPVDKLNVAALGNITAQFHVHVVGRSREDELWPDPVWGRGPARPYDAAGLMRRLEVLSLIQGG
jgi:diadenosine tetraphosphate (Ap4A) HIT family hydrolase